MKWSFNINQRAIMENNFSVDVVDAAVFDLIKDFSHSDSCRKSVESGVIYFWINWKLISNQAPILKLNTRQSVYNRIEKLVENGLLDRHPQNKQLGQSWFCFGKNYDKMVSYTVNNDLHPVNETLHPVNNSLQVSTKPVNETLHPVNETLQVLPENDLTCKLSFTHPVNETLHYTSNKEINNNINIISFKNENSEKNENLPEWAKKEKEEFLQAVEEMQKESPPSSAPPPLTREDFEAHLLKMDSGREQMGRSLKLYQDSDYLALINQFLTEQIDDGTKWKDVYHCGKHFRRWIPYVSFKSKPVNKLETDGKQYSPSPKPAHKDVLQLVNERYFGHSE